MVSHSGLITVMTRAARKAAPRLRRDFGEVEQLQVSRKGPADFVSMADKRAEQTIVEELRSARPDWGMLLEEGGVIEGNPDKPRWIVDPLDGTTNFLHGIPHWAISVGIEKRTGEDTSEVVAGVVYNPAADEMFWAERGMGAFLNDRRLRVSGRRDLHEAVFATGIPFAAIPRKAEFTQILARIMPQVAGVRRFGSAALDLAWLAAGRYDGYWELGIHPWDMAAGLVMVREAGGFVTDPEGGDAWASGDVVAGNSSLHGRLRDFVTEGIAAASVQRSARSAGGTAGERAVPVSSALPPGG